MTLTAKEAWEITLKAEKNNAEKFYEQFKEKLFPAILNQAGNRSSSLSIDDKNELNEYSFISYKPLRDKVQSEVEKLGFTFDYYEDRGYRKVVIGWKQD